jgi:cytochrome c553
MAQTMRAGWTALVTLSAMLAGTQAIAQSESAPEASTPESPAPQAPAASAPAASAPATKQFPHEVGKAQDGATKAATCLACHGPNGNSTNPEWPALAGQSAVYTADQLRLFRAGVRTNPVMMPMAAGLSDQDINDLAVYYAAQTPAGLESDPSFWQAGEKLYRSGDPARNIPACIACHGPVGRGNVAAGYPALRAQHSVYTVKQLNEYASGVRYAGARPDSAAQPSPNSQMMIAVAKRLTPEDIRNVASYLQGMR